MKRNLLWFIVLSLPAFFIACSGQVVDGPIFACNTPIGPVQAGGKDSTFQARREGPYVYITGDLGDGRKFRDVIPFADCVQRTWIK